MGKVIEWSQIHPSIRSESPFVGVVIIDPQRQICVSETIPLESEQLASVERAGAELIAVAQQAAAAVARGYRRQRSSEAPAASDQPPAGLLVLSGGLDPGAG
jgi:hypothetical protein